MTNFKPTEPPVATPTVEPSLQTTQPERELARVDSAGLAKSAVSTLTKYRRPILITFGVIVSILVLRALFSDHSQGTGQVFAGLIISLFVLVAMFVAVALWLLPTFIAAQRHHPSLMAIAAVNILGSWVFGIGWLLALIWALSNNSSSATSVVVVSNTPALAAPVVYQVGDVVNGHRFNGSEWRPI
jgi:uncharacterized membrane protein YedE/YeeE